MKYTDEEFEKLEKQVEDEKYIRKQYRMIKYDIKMLEENKGKADMINLGFVSINLPNFQVDIIIDKIIELLKQNLKYWEDLKELGGII